MITSLLRLSIKAKYLWNHIFLDGAPNGSNWKHNKPACCLQVAARQEVKMLKSLEHPNVVGYRGACLEARGHLLLVMVTPLPQLHLVYSLQLLGSWALLGSW